MIQNIPSYVINLELYKEKWIKTLNTLQELDISPQRFEAVYGKSLDPKIINKITDPSVYYSIKNGRSIDQQLNSMGAIGCYLSHIKLWEMLVKSDKDMFLIFEDDVNISPYVTSEDVNNFVKNVISENPNWDFIFLGFTKPLPFFSKDVCENGICKIKEITFCLHSYIINKKGAKKLLEKAFPIVHQIDSYISYMSARDDIECFRPEKSLFGQENSIKNIFSSMSSIQESPIKSVKTIITRFENNTICYSLLFFIIIFFLFFLFLYFYIKKLKNK